MIMKTSKHFFSVFFLTVVFFSASAQEENLNAVKTEIIEVSDAETQAFISGDCDKVVSLMDDNITFHANGRKAMSKEEIKSFCNSIPRPFSEPISFDTKFYPLTKNSGYSIRMMELNDEHRGHVKEIVTKVWKKGKEGWRMVHFHNTVKPIDNL